MEIGTEIKEANNKIGKLETMVKNLTVLVKDQQDKISKKEGQDLNQEYIGQVIFKRIPFRMKSLAEEKLKCSEVQRFQWLQTTSNGDFLTLWISHNSNTMMTNAIRLKLNWERELPPNSPERKLVSLIIVEQVAPRSYRPLLAKLKNELVNMRENGTFVPTFVQTVKYEANSGTLAYVYQQKPMKSVRATVLGYVANRPLEGREFKNVPWYDTRTGQLQGRFNERPGASAANGAIRKTAQSRPDNKHPQFASGSNKQPIIERGGGDSQHTYPDDPGDPASISEEEMDQDQSINAKRKRSPNPETPTKPNKPAKTASSLAIENRKPTPIKPFSAEISSLEIDQTSSEYGLIDGILKLHASTEDVNLDRAENEDDGIAAPQEPQDVETEPLNKDNTTLSMKAASALYNKVTAAKDKFKR